MNNTIHRQLPSLALLALVASLARSAHAQAQITPLPLESGARFTSTVTGSISRKAALKSGGVRYGDVSSQEISAAFNQTIPVADHALLGVGLGYDRTALNFSGAPVPLPNRLQSVAVDVSYSQRFSETFAGVVGVNSGYHNAGTGFSSKGLGTLVAVGGIYRLSPTLSLSAGGGYDSLAHGRRYSTALSVDGRLGEKWRFSAGYPKTSVTYLFSDAFEVSAIAAGSFHTYYVDRDPRPGLVGKPTLDRTTLEYNDTRVGIAATYKFANQLTLTGTVGAIVDRQFDYHQRNFKLRADDTAAYGSVGLGWRF